MPGSSLGGFTEGLWQSVAESRADSQRREEAAAEREAKFYSLLAEHGDDDMRAMGVAGMLEQANPKRRAKGLRGFLGEMDASATLPKIRQLLATPVQETVTTPGLPSRGIHPGDAMQAPGAPPQMGGMALPTTSPTTGGPPPRPDLADESKGLGAQPPPAPPIAHDAFDQVRGTPAVGRTEQVPHPHPIFMTPQQRELEGDATALRQIGVPEDQIQQALRSKVGGRYGLGLGSGVDSKADIIPDPESPTGFSRVWRDNRTGEVSHTPAMDPTRLHTGSQPPLKVLAKPDGSPGLYRVNADNSTTFVADVPKGMKAIKITNADGSENLIEIPPQFVAPDAGAPGVTPVAQGAGPAVPTAPTAGGPPAPATAAPPAPSAPPAPIQTRAAAYTPVTVKTADGKIAPALKSKDGQFLDPTTKAPLTGALEVPNSVNVPATSKPLSADAKKTLESVDAILPMMDRVTAALGDRGTDPSEGFFHQGLQVLHGMSQQAEYSLGLNPTDPAYSELLPLIANLKVMATSPYLHGVRNMHYIQQIQAHLPSVTDSPLLIRQKLAQMKPTLEGLVAAVHEVEGGGSAAPGAGGDPRIGTVVPLKGGRSMKVTRVDPTTGELFGVPIPAAAATPVQ